MRRLCAALAIAVALSNVPAAAQVPAPAAKPLAVAEDSPTWKIDSSVHELLAAAPAGERVSVLVRLWGQAPAEYRSWAYTVLSDREPAIRKLLTREGNPIPGGDRAEQARLQHMFQQLVAEYTEQDADLLAEELRERGYEARSLSATSWVFARVPQSLIEEMSHLPEVRRISPWIPPVDESPPPRDAMALAAALTAPVVKLAEPVTKRVKAVIDPVVKSAKAIVDPIVKSGQSVVDTVTKSSSAPATVPTKGAGGLVTKP